MSRKGDVYGEEGQQIKLQKINEALLLTSTYFSGEVLLVPSPTVIAEAIGRTTGYLYKGFHERPAQSYRAALEEATGLVVIHKGGLVLGGEVDDEFKSLPK